MIFQVVLCAFDAVRRHVVTSVLGSGQSGGEGGDAVADDEAQRVVAGGDRVQHTKQYHRPCCVGLALVAHANGKGPAIERVVGHQVVQAAVGVGELDSTGRVLGGTVGASLVEHRAGEPRLALQTAFEPGVGRYVGRLRDEALVREIERHLGGGAEVVGFHLNSDRHSCSITWRMVFTNCLLPSFASSRASTDPLAFAASTRIAC